MRTRILGPLACLCLLAGVWPAQASNDPGFEQQWGLTQVGAPAAWPRSTGSGVRIGVVDTGIDLNHEDLKGKVVDSVRCRDTDGSAGQCSGSAQDDHGHGTHVAGIATAYKDNGSGVAGVAPDAQLVVAKVLYKNTNPDDGGASGSVRDINAGIRWVVDHGAKVVNLSLGSDLTILTGLFGDDSLDEGIDYAWSKGAVPVLASGNSNFLGFGSANYGDVNALVVGATGPDGDVTSYSSPLGNAKWGLVAPGGDSAHPDGCAAATARCVLSTYWRSGSTGNLYGYLEGTSMAAPHVSGAVAALLAQGLSREQTVTRILQSAAKGDCGSGCQGRLDLANAVGAGPAPTPPPSGGGGTGTTTPSTRRSTTATTRPAAQRTTTTLPGTTIIEEDTTTSSTDVDVEGDDLEAAQLPTAPSDDPDDSDAPPAVPTALALVGLLGVGGMAAPLMWRRFRPGG